MKVTVQTHGGGYKWRAEQNGYEWIWWTLDRLPSAAVMARFMDHATYALKQARKI